MSWGHGRSLSHVTLWKVVDGGERGFSHCAAQFWSPCSCLLPETTGLSAQRNLCHLRVPEAIWESWFGCHDVRIATF